MKPTASLDLKNKKKIFKLLESLVIEGVSVLVVTHDAYFLKGIQGNILHFFNYQVQLKSINDQLIESLY